MSTRDYLYGEDIERNLAAKAEREAAKAAAETENKPADKPADKAKG